MPVGGAAVGDLYATTGSPPTSGKSVVVEVLDVTSTGITPVLSCEVASGTSTCSASSSAAVAVGDYIAVRLKTGGGYSLNGTIWRVSFRF